MDARLFVEYMRLRGKGYKALNAMRDARVKAEWRRLKGATIMVEDGKAFDSIWDEGDSCEAQVRLVVMCDYNWGWNDGMDFDCEDRRCTHGKFGVDTDAFVCNEHRSMAERIERDGMYGIKSEYRHPTTGEWIEADHGCWGFIGDDWKDSGYDVDAMSTAIEERSKVNGC